MSRWSKALLGAVCEINPKQNGADRLPPDAEVSFVPMAAIDETSGRIAMKETRPLDSVTKGYTPFRNDDVLFAKITPCMENGKAAIARELTNGVGFGSTEFHVLRPKPGLLPEWVFAFIRQPAFRDLAKANFTGTAGQQRVPADFLKQIQLPLPPLPEQERIVRILDEAEALRRLRARANERSSALIPSLFEQMLGNPSSNPKHWETMRLRDICDKFSDGPFGSNLKSEHYTQEGVRVIRLQNIGVGSLIDDDKAFIAPQHFDRLRKHECLPGDVLVATLGDPNLRACVLPPHIDRALNKADCVQIRPKPEQATAEYLCCLLNLPATLSMASGMIAGQTRSRISMGRLAELMVPVPPIELQHAFTVRVAAMCELETAQAANHLRLDDLFQSLLHRAFEGEL